MVEAGGPAVVGPVGPTVVGTGGPAVVGALVVSGGGVSTPTGRNRNN